MRKIFLFSLSLIIGMTLLIWIYQRIGLEGVFLKFNFLGWWQILILFLLTLVRILIWTWRWQLILKAMGITHISFKSLSAARLGEMSVSYLTPGIYWGGEIVRILGLKNKKGIRLTKGIISVILDRLFDIAGFCLFIFFIILVFLLGNNFLGALALFLLGLGILAFFIFILKIFSSKKILIFLVKLFRLKKIKYINNLDLPDKIGLISQEINSFFKKPALVIYPIILLSSISFFTGIFQLMFFLIFLKESYTFAGVLIMRVIIMVSSVLPIPANLGIYEGVSVLVFKGFGLTAETGLSFTLITRLIDFTFVALGIFLIIYYAAGYLIKFLNKNNHLNSKN